MAQLQPISKPLAKKIDKAERTKPEVVQDMVTFTSFDGKVLEIPDLPQNLGRATAMASEKALNKIWGTAEEETACHDMRKEI